MWGGLAADGRQPADELHERRQRGHGARDLHVRPVERVGRAAEPRGLARLGAERLDDAMAGERLGSQMGDVLHLLLAAPRAADADDVDDLRPVEDGHVHGEARLVAQPLEVRPRELGQLHRVDRREAEIEDARLIENAMVPEGRVAPGTKVSFLELDSGDTREVEILGPWDADGERVVSYRSPLAKGMLGRSVGDEVVLQLPSSQLPVRILSIEPLPL